MSALGNLVVSLSLEHAAFTQGLDKGSQEALKFAKNTQDAMDRMERSVQGFIGKVAGIGVAYLSLNSVYNSINKQVDALAQLDDAAQKTGASVELLSKIQKTAIAFGEDFGTKIEPAITKLAKGIAGLDDPTNKANAALKALGIQARDTNGQFRDAAQITIDVAKALQGYRDDASKTALAIDLFGKSGAEAMPFLNDLAENVDKFSTVSAEAAGNAAALQDSLNLQKQRWDEFTQQLTISVLPALNDMAGAFFDIQKNSNGLASDNSIANWADDLALTIAPLYDTLVNLKNEVYAVGKSFQVVLADVNVASARLKTLNPLAYATGDPQKALTEAEAYRARVLSEANSAYGDAVNRPRDEYEAALRARIASRPNRYASPSTAIDKGGLPSVGYLSGQDAKDATAAQKAASEAVAAKKAYDTLTDSINKQIEAKRAEYSVTGPLSEAEKALLDVNLKRADGQLKLTEAQYANVKSLLDTLEAETSNAEMSKIRLQAEQDYLTLIEQTNAARGEIYTTMQDETTALEELAKAKVDELDQMRMTKAQIDALNVARYDEQIGVLETQKAYLESQPERENEIELIERQIEALKTLRGTVGQAEAINKSKAEVDAMFGSMENAARLVWTVFANSGENAAKAAGAAIKASILDLLYQMTIKKFFIQVQASITPTGAVNDLIGTTAGNPNASIFERITDGFKSINTTFSSSIEKLGAFLSNGQGGLADKIGGFLGQYSSEIASGLGYLSSAYMLSQGNIAGAALTAAGTYFLGPIGGAIGGALGSLFGGKVSTKKYSTGVTGLLSDGKFTSSNQSGLAGYGRALGGNEGLAQVLKDYSIVVNSLFDAFDMGGDVNTAASLFQRSSKKTRAWGYFSANAGGGSVGFSSAQPFGSAQAAMEDLVNRILTEGITTLVTSSNLPEGVRMLFDGLSSKETIQGMIAASINLGNAQEALIAKYDLTADQAGKVAVASGNAGDSLAAFVNALSTTAYNSLKTSEQMLQQRDSLNDRLAELGADASINGNLKAFDAFLKSLPKTTAEAQKQFADLFSLRDTVGSVQTAWDQIIAGVNGSLYELMTPAEQAAKDSAALAAMFAELGLQVPQTAAELAALGQTIQQNFNAADEASIDLALAFPSLVAAFTSAKDKIIDNAREMNQFTNLADYRFYKGVQYNYGNQYANDYAGVSRLFGSNAAGKTTLNGESIADLKQLLADLRDTTKQALVVQRGTQSALEQIQARGLKTV